MGEDLKKSTNQKQEIPVVAMFVNDRDKIITELRTILQRES
jgi:hypothetical protein